MCGSPGASDHCEHDLAFTGLGRSGFGTQQGRTWTSLAFEACTQALGDARLTRDEIDGLCVHGGSTGLPGISAGGARRVLHTLDLHPTWHSGSTQSPGQVGSLISAMLAISAGLCRHVLCLDVRPGGGEPRGSLPEASAAATAGATALVISSARCVPEPRRAVWIDALGTRRAGTGGSGGHLADGRPGGYGQLYQAVLERRGDPTGSAMAIAMRAERT